MKKQILVVALLISATFMTPALGIASRISRITSGALCCAAGIYALMQAKESYDWQGYKRTHKANRGMFELAENVFSDQTSDEIEDFYNNHKYTIHACGWGGSGLAAIAVGLTLIFR